MTSPLLPDLGAVRFAQRRDAGGVLNATVAFVRETARPLLVGYLAIVGPVALAGGLAALLFFRSFTGILADPAAAADPDALAQMFGPTYFGTILFSLLTAATTVAFAAGIVRRYREGATADEMTVGALWDETRPLILPTLGMSLLFVLVVGVSAVVNAVPCLGTLAWLAGLVWALPHVQVAFAVRLLEGGTAPEAVTRARALVKGRWGFAMGAILLSWVVAYVVVMALSVPLYAAAGLFSIGTMTDPAAMGRMLESLGWVMAPLQVLSTAVLVLPMLSTFFVHGSLSDRQDGGALWAEVDRLDGGLAAAPERPAPSDAPPADRRAASDELDTRPGPPDDAPPRDAPPPDAPGFRGGGFGPPA